MSISNAQALKILVSQKGKWRNAKHLKIGVKRLLELEEKGLIESRHDRGSLFLPETCIYWRLRPRDAQ